MNTKWRTRLHAFWRGWVKPIVIVVVVLSTFRSAIADWNDVPTGSMKPTILEGDRIFVNKLAYSLKFPFTTWSLAEWSQPVRGDVIVLFSPADGTRLVKRVVAVGGDRIAMFDNRLYINGESLEYAPSTDEYAMAPRFTVSGEKLDGGFHPMMIDTAGAGSVRRSFKEVAVPKDHFFVMGDNRDHSADSRVWGFVEKSLIVGRVKNVVLSINRDTWVPRWDRFFHSLH